MKSVEGGVQCGQAAYTQDRNICILGANMPIVYLLPRRGKYTRVYTVVYLRVHNIALSMSSVEHSCMSIHRG